MIYVDRAAVSCPPSLVGPNCDGAKELRKAEPIIAKNQKYKFECYRAEEVKAALRQLFNGKCAYCESPVSITSPGDVEHYRPKGELTENGQRLAVLPHGYYWLAADWHNLLFACEACNRPSHQAVISAPGPTGGQRTKIGKDTEFPLLTPATRARQKGQEAQEDPVLLHPCVDDPTQHLTFIHAQNGAAKVTLGLAQGQDARGQGTIALLGLNRMWLVNARSEHLNSLLDYIGNWQDSLERFRDQRTAQHRAAMQKHLRLFIDRFLIPTKPYLGLTRAVFKENCMTFYVKPEYAPLQRALVADLSAVASEISFMRHWLTVVRRAQGL